MHEMSLCLALVDLLAERLQAEGGTRVVRVQLAIGALGHVEPEALAEYTMLPLDQARAAAQSSGLKAERFGQELVRLMSEDGSFATADLWNQASGSLSSSSADERMPRCWRFSPTVAWRRL